MFFHQRFVPGLAAASYVVGDEDAGTCVVVDPLRDAHEYLRIAEDAELRIAHVVETHVHADFVSGSAELKARLGPGVTVHASGLGGPEWTPPYADHVVRDGDEFDVGRLRLRAIHTPGHTPEHVAWALFDLDRSADTPWLLLTGDFVFVGSVGRPDLLGPESRERLAHDLYRSVFDVLPRFPDFTEIFPAHGAGSLCGKALGSRRSSTLGYERRFSEPLRPAEEAVWIRGVLEEMPDAPPYFRRMKKVNAEGPRVLGAELPGTRSLHVDEFARRRCDPAVVLDVREGEAFAAGHVAGSIHVGLGANLATWAGWILPYDRPVLLVADDSAAAREAAVQLLRIGFDDLAGHLAGGFESWRRAGRPVATLTTVAPDELVERPDVVILDVRSPGEWRAGHVEGARHVPIQQVESRCAEIPADRDVAVVCGSGYRSSIVCSILARTGYRRISNVRGGMAAWRSAGLATVSG